MQRVHAISRVRSSRLRSRSFDASSSEHPLPAVSAGFVDTILPSYRSDSSELCDSLPVNCSTFFSSPDYTGFSVLGFAPRKKPMRLPKPNPSVDLHTMSNEPSQFSPIFSINVSAESGATPASGQRPAELGATLVALTRQLIDVQHRQNQLMEQLLQVNKQVLQSTSAANTQRQSELTQWRNAHPKLVRSCKSALETLSGVQTEFLQKMAEEVEDTKEELAESEYIFSDFLDRYGPRMAHLNGVLQVLSHLSG